MDKKKNILIIFGGCSPEYGVSLQSAAGVISHLDNESYVPIPLGISREGRWFRYYGPVEAIAEDRWLNEKDCVPALLSPDRGDSCLLVLAADGPRRERIDGAFPVLHGKNGEDGTVQGLIELAGIPLIGCGTLASALCMDKDRAHRLAALAGIKVPDSFVIERGFEPRAALARAESLGYPLFVKPVRAGSSFGVTRVEEPDGLLQALDRALKYDGQAIMEQEIPGFEVGCAVVGGEKLIFGEIDEIELQGGFFNFEEKYKLISSRIHVPARIDPGTSSRLKEAAGKIYRALGCSGFARVDMFLSPSGEIFFNEVNTIPGFTPHSRFPGMMKAAGLDFGALLRLIISGEVG